MNVSPTILCHEDSVDVIHCACDVDCKHIRSVLDSGVCYLARHLGTWGLGAGQNA